MVATHADVAADGAPGTGRVAALDTRLVTAVAVRLVAAAAAACVPTTIHTRVAADGGPCAG